MALPSDEVPDLGRRVHRAGRGSVESAVPPMRRDVYVSWILQSEDPVKRDAARASEE